MRLRLPLEKAGRNAEFLGRHAGQRCFILCNGPSVKRQNLAALKDEHVVSVSSGYHHPLYAQIAPRYHCVPQLTYGLVTREDAIAWFKEMDAALGDATLFLSSTEEPLVREEGLFAGRDVRYIVLSGNFSDYPEATVPDIAARIPRVQSVPVMCIMIAMYMGFDQIYLLGTDHDHFRTGEYKYFYESKSTALSGKDISADEQGKRRSGWYEELTGLVRLWEQYRTLGHIAQANGVRIFNATAGGELDEFPRVDFDSLFASALRPA